MTEQPDDTNPAPIQEASPDVIDVVNAPMTFQTLKAISRTNMVPGAYRGKPYEMFACVLAGRELGMGPMESMRRIDVIDGKPSPSAEWMIAQVMEAGHLIYPELQTDTECTVVGVRYDARGVVKGESSFTYTLKMAARANLTGKSNWKNYPEAMLYWRAASQLCRQFFPDVLGGMKYLADELGDELVAPEIVTSDSPEETIEAEIVEVDTEIEVDQWSELLGLLNETPDEGTMKVIEQRVRQMYHLVGILPAEVLEPGIDWFHTHLEMHYNAQHWSELRRADVEKFAVRAWGWAKELVEKTYDQEEADDGPGYE